MTSVPSTGNFALAPTSTQEDDIPGVEIPPWLRRSRSSCRRLLSSPLSYGRFRENLLFRERERGLRRPCVDDEDNDEYDGGDDDDDDNSNNSNNNTTQQNDHEGKIESEDERRVRRRHSELFRSGAPLFIPHVMLCGRYVMLLLLPVNLISLSLSLSRSLPPSSFLLSLFPSLTTTLSYRGALSYTFHLLLHLYNN